jgi:lysophospholipase L1-like esterase
MQDKPARSQWRGLQLNAAAFILALLLSCLAVEIVLRAVKLNPYGMLPRRVDIRQNGVYIPGIYWGTTLIKRPSTFSEFRMGEYIPGLNFRFLYASNPRGYFDRENAVAAQINAHGTRGTDFSMKKAAGSFRIIGLGDSFTFGEGVRLGDVFLSRLQNLLNRKVAGKYEVINCGVSSYNTRDEVVYLERKWIKLKPDLVLLVFVINDGYADDEFGPLQKGFANGAARLSADAGKKPISVLLAWISSLYERRRISRNTEAMYLSQFSAQPVMAGYSWEESRRMLARAVEVTRKNGAHFAIIIFPELYKLNDDYPFRQIHRQVKEEAGKLGVPILDLFDSFYKMDDRELWVHPTDHHPNETAHAIAADAILKFVTDPKNGLMN